MRPRRRALSPLADRGRRLHELHHPGPLEHGARQLAVALDERVRRPAPPAPAASGAGRRAADRSRAAPAAARRRATCRAAGRRCGGSRPGVAALRRCGAAPACSGADAAGRQASAPNSNSARAASECPVSATASGSSKGDRSRRNRPGSPDRNLRWPCAVLPDVVPMPSGGTPRGRDDRSVRLSAPRRCRGDEIRGPWRERSRESEKLFLPAGGGREEADRGSLWRSGVAAFTAPEDQRSGPSRSPDHPGPGTMP